MNLNDSGLKNMEDKKIKLNTVVFIVIIILFVIVILFVTKKANAPIINNTDNSVLQSDTKILGNVNDLVSFSVAGGEKVSGILNVTGSVQGGYFFEANILVNILDGNKKVIRAGNGNAKGEWMTSGPVGFDAVLDFTKLPKGPAYIEIHNDNASGLPENDKMILIPVIIN